MEKSNVILRQLFNSFIQVYLCANPACRNVLIPLVSGIQHVACITAVKKRILLTYIDRVRPDQAFVLTVINKRYDTRHAYMER